MARRTTQFAAALAAVALSGCALQTPEIGPSPNAAPLQAFIYDAHDGRVQFDLSRPAYAAVFQIIPGQGTVLLYPGGGGGGTDGATFAGLNYARPAFHGNYYGFLPAAIGYAGPRYYFLIASEEPLNLSQFGPYGSSLRSHLGVHFASMNAYGSMERLVELAVPNVESGEWTADFYVEWPNVIFDNRPIQRRDLVAVKCGDYVAWVPIDRVQEATAVLCAEEGAEVPGLPNAPADSTETVEPIRRPPAEPTFDRISSSQLEKPEEWDIRRRAADRGISLSADDLESIDVPAIRERMRDDTRENPQIGRGAAGIPDRGVERSVGSTGSTGSSQGARAEPSSPDRGISRDNPPVSRDNQ